MFAGMILYPCDDQVLPDSLTITSVSKIHFTSAVLQTLHVFGFRNRLRAFRSFNDSPERTCYWQIEIIPLPCRLLKNSLKFYRLSNFRPGTTIPTYRRQPKDSEATNLSKTFRKMRFNNFEGLEKSRSLPNLFKT